MRMIIVSAGFAIVMGLVLLLRPLWVLRVQIVVLGLVPFASVAIAGVQVQVCLVLTFVYAVGWLMFGRYGRVGTGVGPSRAALAIWLSIGLAGLSYLATRGPFGFADDAEFAKWLLATLLGLCLLGVPAREFVRLLRLFTVSVTCGALFAIVALFSPGGSTLLGTLSALGYERSADNRRYFIQDGVAVGLRLAGTYVDPNIAALFFTVAITLALVTFRGSRRIVLVASLGVGLALTLSRGGMLAFGVTMLTLIVLMRREFGRRLFTSIALLGIATVLLAVPTVRLRLLGTFGSGDIGANSRSLALAGFREMVSGHWLFGLGWGRPEFRVAGNSYVANMVANAPLAAIYRGGLVEAAGLILLLSVCLIAAIAALRRSDWRYGLVGASFVGFLFAIQTGYSVVTIAPMTCLLSVVAAMTWRRDYLRDGVSDPASALMTVGDVSLLGGRRVGGDTPTMVAGPRQSGSSRLVVNGPAG